jgi:hypothetical protein
LPYNNKAAHNGVSLKNLIAANPQIKNPNLIFQNQKINMPSSMENRSLENSEMRNCTV